MSGTHGGLAEAHRNGSEAATAWRAELRKLAAAPESRPPGASPPASRSFLGEIQKLAGALPTDPLALLTSPEASPDPSATGTPAAGAAMPCPACDGAGTGPAGQPCAECLGSAESVPCPACGGDGLVTPLLAAMLAAEGEGGDNPPEKTSAPAWMQDLWAKTKAAPGHAGRFLKRHPAPVVGGGLLTAGVIAEALRRYRQPRPEGV